ncbi:MAG: branched-chain amino acid ABC transporter substrate-binding protein [Micromonosporaceae bacterium]
MRQRLVRVLGSAAVAAVVVAGAAACGSGDTAGGGDGDKCGLKIAFFGALTGSTANLGINIKNGAALAVEQYNEENPDCQVILHEADSEGSPDKAPGLARQLVTDQKIIGIIGPAFSGESEAANPIFDEAGMPIISASATGTILGQQGWKVFHRAVANDAAQGPAAGNYIKNVLKAEKVVVVDDGSAYGAGLADAVKEVLGSTVVDTDKVAADGQQTDFSATVTKVLSSGATALFYGGYYQNAGLLRKQLSDRGWTGTLIGADGVNDPGYVEAAGNAAAAGTIVTCPCAPATQAKGSFAEDYKARWNMDPGTYSDVAYDAANIFLEGIKAGNTTKEKMLEYLDGVNYTGVANTYKFTENGELDPSLLIVWAFKVDESGNVVPEQEIPQS